MNVATPPPGEPLAEPVEPGPDHLAEDPIVQGLKRLYDSVLEEPVPDEFLAILHQIDESLAQAANHPAKHNGVDTSGTVFPGDGT